MSVWNNGRFAYYRGRGIDVLANRGRPQPYRARQTPTARLRDPLWSLLGDERAGEIARG